MAHAIFYMHQTSGACAGVCACDHTHQMEKTDVEGHVRKKLNLNFMSLVGFPASKIWMFFLENFCGGGLEIIFRQK